MKVCWFTNVPFPSACRAAGMPVRSIGGWLPSLGKALVDTGKLELLVVSFVPGASHKSIQVDRSAHELIAIEPKKFTREAWSYPSARVRQKCCEIIAQFQPDLVHIHGTEYSYGLLLTEGDIRCPAVISIQGLLGAYTRTCWGSVTLAERLANSSFPDLRGPGGLIHGRRTMARRARRVETPTLLNDAVFTGRTLFDRAYLRAANPKARYCHCDEVLRPPFFAAKRDAGQIRPYSIFAFAGRHPRKGIHCLLKAVAQLKDEFPQITVRACDLRLARSLLRGGYEAYLRRLIRSLNLKEHVIPLALLDAEAVAHELTRAHLFAFPSFADNSPNALGEAMLVGAPVVTSFVGGIPSMVRDKQTAMCFPAGDDVVMAECIRKIFTDDGLALRLARNAQKVARKRHDPKRIASRMLDIYGLALAGDGGTRSEIAR